MIVYIKNLISTITTHEQIEYTKEISIKLRKNIVILQNVCRNII